MRIKSRSFQPTGRGAQTLALAGLIGALAASSCCILPVLLFSLGISGAWIANFTQLAPYHPIFSAATVRIARNRLLARLPLVAPCLRRRSGLRARVIEASCHNRVGGGDDHRHHRFRVRFCRAVLALMTIGEAPMRIPVTAIIVGIGVSVASHAFAAERTLTLTVQNMYCAACPHTVRASLQAVPGVDRVMVSMQEKTATVTYDDAKTNVNALTAATANAGYPSTPKG